MPFLQTFSIETDKVHPIPFNIPAIRNFKGFKELRFDNPLTLIIGQNGSGKSTLLKTIALHLDIPLVGGPIQHNESFKNARCLQPYVKIRTNRPIPYGFFFSPEDSREYINAVQKTKNRILDSLQDLQGEVDDAIISQMGENMNYPLREMRQQYGDNLQTLSHGEATMAILQTKIHDQGIYLLDEPENGMHPDFELAFITLILQKIKNGNCQFIISTHSTLIGGIPGANLYEIQASGIQRTEYTQTRLYQLTKYYLDNPDAYKNLEPPD